LQFGSRSTAIRKIRRKINGAGYVSKVARDNVGASREPEIYPAKRGCCPFARERERERERERAMFLNKNFKVLIKRSKDTRKRLISTSNAMKLR
jgi:hypothetical protein